MSDTDCLFCRMLAGEILMEPLVDTEQIFAIRDINPRAPVHVLIIPKHHIPSAQDLTLEDGPLVAHLLAGANAVARIEGVDQTGFRLAFNVGEAAGMTIPHLHLHLLGGRPLGPEG